MLLRHIGAWLNSHGWRWPALFLTLGAMERAAWLVAQRHLGFAQGEAGNTAIAFARTGEIADVFAKGSGLTAHLNPILPMFAGSLYRLFGIRSVPAELILATLSIGTALLSAALFYHIFGLLGGNRRARLTALALFCLVPVNIQMESITFRIWEGAVAMALAAGTLLLIIQADRAQRVSYRRITFTSLLAALLFFLSPALGLALYVCAIIWAVRRLPLARWPATAAIATTALAIVLAPWTIRNYQAFHQFIPLRSNFGLELALANHPAAVSGQNEAAVFRARLSQIHPLENGGAFERMQAAGGERAYADHLGQEAKAWIATHPGDFARLSIRHLKQFYFPPAWQWSIYGQTSKATMAKMALLWAISFCGLAGALYALLLWRGLWLYAATVVLIPSLPYIITQPVARYRYIVYATLLFLGCEWISRILSWIRRTRAQ